MPCGFKTEALSKLPSSTIKVYFINIKILPINFISFSFTLERFSNTFHSNNSLLKDIRIKESNKYVLPQKPQENEKREYFKLRLFLGNDF